MYIEYYINTIEDKDIDIKNSITNIIDNYKKPFSVAASIHHIKFIQKTYPNIPCGAYVDYPLSHSDMSRRQDLIMDALKLRVNFINITIPFYSIINRKYDKFRDDIKKNIDLCGQAGVELRYCIEYRKFDHALLCKICEILIQGGVKTAYPSTGFFIDNLNDNIIACAYLNEKTGINMIINGNLWHKDQMKDLVKIQPYGFSSNNIFNFRLINEIE